MNTKFLIPCILFVAISSSCTSIKTNVRNKKEQNLSQSLENLTESTRGLVPSDVQGQLDEAQVKAKEQIVYYTMSDLKQAVEDWSTKHNYKYPYAIDSSLDSSLAKYMNKNELLPPEYFRNEGIVNPFTKKANWPKTGTISDVMVTRRGEPFPIPPGEIQYNQLMNGEHYAILGGSANGKALPDLHFKPQGCKTEVESDVFDLK